MAAGFFAAGLVAPPEGVAFFAGAFDAGVFLAGAFVAAAFLAGAFAATAFFTGALAAAGFAADPFAVAGFFAAELAFAAGFFAEGFAGVFPAPVAFFAVDAVVFAVVFDAPAAFFAAGFAADFAAELAFAAGFFAADLFELVDALVFVGAAAFFAAVDFAAGVEGLFEVVDVERVVTEALESFVGGGVGGAGVAFLLRPTSRFSAPRKLRRGFFSLLDSADFATAHLLHICGQ